MLGISSEDRYIDQSKGGDAEVNGISVRSAVVVDEAEQSAFLEC